MDTTKLAVGQDINLDTGTTNFSGKVVKTIESSVYVQIGGSGEHIRFDNGVQFGVDPMSEIGPLVIDEVPFAERKQTIRERRARDYQPFITWWKTASYDQRLALVTKYYATRAALSLEPLAAAETIAKFDDVSGIWIFLEELAKEKAKG
jgi:hypothetical protein